MNGDLRQMRIYQAITRLPGGPEAKTRTANEGESGLIPGQETRPHMPRVKIPCCHKD